MPAAVLPDARTGSVHPTSNNYDDAVDDFLKDISMGNDNTTRPTEPAKDVDEEIKVRKKRAPVPKLDEACLLSDAGVSKLRKIAKTRLKFKGKGHEFTDMARLLNTYQLWLDDLYPRAKFRDALTMVEKLGHSKRMQITRKGWIDDTKPNHKEDTLERREDSEMDAEGLVGGETERRRDGGIPDDELFGSDPAPRAAGGHERGNFDQDMPDDDELDALLNAPLAKPAMMPTSKPRGPFEDDSDDEDELAALMAEQDTTTATKPGLGPRPPDRLENEDDDQDDLDALMAEQDSYSKTGVVSSRRGGLFEEDDDDEDQDDLDALMAEQESTKPVENVGLGPDPEKQQQHYLDDVVDDENPLAGMDES